MNEVAEYIIENIPEARQAANKKLAQKLPKHSSKKVVLDGKVNFSDLKHFFFKNSAVGLKLRHNSGGQKFFSFLFSDSVVY